jgi:hypothetical protein
VSNGFCRMAFAGLTKTVRDRNPKIISSSLTAATEISSLSRLAPISEMPTHPFRPWAERLNYRSAYKDESNWFARPCEARVGADWNR